MAQKTVWLYATLDPDTGAYSFNISEQGRELQGYTIWRGEVNITLDDNDFPTEAELDAIVLAILEDRRTKTINKYNSDIQAIDDQVDIIENN